MTNLLGRGDNPTSNVVIAAVLVSWIAVMLLAAPVSAQDGPGIRAGLSANPDQFFIGGHYVTSPIWDRLRFQPSVEAGFGDDRTVVAFNMEFGYWMKLSADWQAYFGAGPAMVLSSSSGKGQDDVGPGLNIFLGLRRRGGLFFEMKVGAFDSPDFKLGVGYTFR